MSISPTFQSLIVTLLLTLFASSARAVECSAIFPGVAQSAGNAGSIEIKNNGHLYGIEEIAGQRRVYTTTLNSHSTACNDDTCTQVNSPAEKGTFNSFPGGGDITVNENDELTLAPGDYKKLKVKKNGTLILTPGQYTFSDDVVIEDEASINLESTGSVQFYSKKKIDIKEDVNINQTGDGGHLFIFSAKEIVVGEDSQVKAILYAKKKIEVKKNADLLGLATGEKELIVSEQATVSFDNTALGGTDFGAFCEGLPVANDDSANVTANGSVTIDVTANDSNVDPSTVTINAPSPSIGTVVNNGDGTIVYTDVGGTGVTFSYQVGDGSGNFDMANVTITVLAVHGEWRLDEADWSGSTNEVLDNSGNGYHAEAVNGADTLGSDPVIAGSPGTCRYGDFDDAGGASGGYLEIASFPNQTTNFTITGWIRSNDVSRSGQRMFADDQSNSGGYALSLGDPGSGRMRFYARGTSPISLDSPVVITNNTWYFIAGVADITNSQKTLYIYSADGTLLNTTSGSFTGTWGTDSGPATIGGETNSGETTNRFFGNLDEIRFYQGVLGSSQLSGILAETHACNGASAVDHYAISYDGGNSYGAAEGATCEASYVTVVAHGSIDDHQPVTPQATTSITLTTLPTTAIWSDSGSNSISHSFDGSTSSVTLALQQTSAETININVNNSSGNGDEDPGEDASISFADTAFLFYGDGVVNNVGTQIAGKPSDQAPGLQTLQLRAVRTNEETSACEALLSDNETVQMAYQCSDPETCQAGDRVRIHGTTPIPGNPTSGVGNYGDVLLDFGDDGIATFSFDYSDAGKLVLHANKQIEASGDNPAVTLAGSSNSFVVRPFGFYLDVIDNPAAEDAGGDPFQIAGDVFTTDVSAVVWQAADDDGSTGGTANDGIPDSNDALQDNDKTPNFGQEIVAETVMIEHLLVAPDSGVNPALIEAEFSGFSNGTSSNDGMSWAEVGIISFAADLIDNDYLGSGESVIGSVDRVGRFYPAHFELITTELTNRSDLVGCVDSDFTYLHESFNSTMTLQANNIDGLVTKNYTDDFAKLITYEQLQFGALGDGVDLSLRLEQGTNSAIISWPTVDSTQAGLGSIDVDLMLLRDDMPDGPIEALEIGIAADDGDAVMNSFDLDISVDGSADHAKVGETDVYFGRARLENAFGPETEALTMTALIEYWDGDSFEINQDDNCTELAITTDPAGPSGISVGSGSSDMINNSPVLAGDLGIHFSAPGAGNSGDINVRLHTIGEPADSGISNLPWLQFDWDNDGNYDDDPGGRIATFGRYRGNDRVFFWRENN